MQGNKPEAKKRGTRLKAPSKGCKQAHTNTHAHHTHSASMQALAIISLEFVAWTPQLNG